MAEDCYSATQTQIDRTIAGIIVPSIQEDDSKQLIEEKAKGSVSSESENRIEMSSHVSNVSIQCKEGNRITVSDGSGIQEKQEMAKEDVGFIHEAESRNGFYSDVKETQENEVLKVVSVYPQDSTVILVVEKEEALEKCPSSISHQSQNNLIEILGKSNSWEDFGNYTSEVKEMEDHHKSIGVPIGKKRSGACSENMKQEVIRNKEKYPKRNGKGMKRFPEMDGRQSLLGFYAEARNFCGKKADGSKRKYSRSEMEALRFVNCDEQRKIWREIYVGLGPVVSRELNGMAEFKNQKFSRRNTDHYQHGGSRNVQGPILSMNRMMATRGRGNHYQIIVR